MVIQDTVAATAVAVVVVAMVAAVAVVVTAVVAVATVVVVVATTDQETVAGVTTGTDQRSSRGFDCILAIMNSDSPAYIFNVHY